MATINLPDNPQAGERYTAGNNEWEFDGVCWILVPEVLGSDFGKTINNQPPDENGNFTIPVYDLSPFATTEAMQLADQGLAEGIQQINEEFLPNKLDKDDSHVPGRVIFVGADNKLIGEAEFTYDAASGQLKINSTTVNNNYKTIIGGSVLVEGAVLAMNSYLSTLIMGDGAANFITDGTGLHIRLFNNDLTDRPDASKSIKLRNKGFVFQDMYIEPLTFNGLGEVMTWRQINKIEKFVKMPDLPAVSGTYNVVVQNEATKELELVPSSGGPGGVSARKRIVDLPLIDDENLSALDDWDEYRTSGGFTKYKLPTGGGGGSTFTGEPTSEFY